MSWIHPDNGRIARGFLSQADGSLEPVALVPRNPNPYDPRKRPWYQKAIEGDGLVWTPPYGFLSSRVIGITAARAIRDSSGEVVGVLGADLELGRLAEFLDEFEVGEAGAAFLLLDGGAAVVPGAARQGAHVETLQKAFESRLWDFSDLNVGETMEEGFVYQGERYIALIQPIDIPGPTRYFAGVVVPRGEYLGIVYRNLFITHVLGVLILAVAIALGVWQARRVTEPLARIGDELEKIGDLSFRDAGVEVQSNIREVALFSDSLGKMKVSLRAFSRYVPRDLVRLLLAQGDEAHLGGSLRKMTVVFTDLVGFTAFSESLTPDEAFSELSEFLEIVAACQEKYGGITSSFTGDGTLALFNARRDYPKHAQDACFSALDLLDALKECNASRKAAGKFEFRARIGINTADVLLGNLGTRERFVFQTGGCVALVFVLSACGRAEEEAGDSGVRLAPVEVLEVTASAGYEVQKRFVGIAEARRRSVLAFELAGTVVEVAVEEGEFTSAAQVFARIDTSRLEARREELAAALAQAVATRDLAAKVRERVERLIVRGGVSMQDLDEAVAQGAAAEAGAGVAQIEAQLCSVEVDFKKSVLRAPYDETAALRHVNEGSVVFPECARARMA